MLVNRLSSSTLRPKKPFERRGVALILAGRNGNDLSGLNCESLVAQRAIPC